MIVVEKWAVCEHCRRKQLADEHPPTWPQVIEGDCVRHYCSRECLTGSLTGATDRPFGLAPADLMIIREVAAGRSNSEVAWAMGRSESTIKNRLSRIFSRFGVNDRANLVIRAYSLSLVEFPRAAAA